jgi:hypothetical protein
MASLLAEETDRPILCLWAGAVGQVVGLARGCALEYSPLLLIHDDLPALDNDDYR